MAATLIFDTTFLVDFQRERRRGDSTGPAHRFLGRNADAIMQLPATVLGEFAEGFEALPHPVLRAMVDLFDLLHVDPETAYRYARITRSLRLQGCLIGTNDLWIAACALRHDRPLVTRNVNEFNRVPGLQVLDY